MKSVRERSLRSLIEAMRLVEATRWPKRRRPFPPRELDDSGVPIDRNPPSTLGGGAAAALSFED